MTKRVKNSEKRRSPTREYFLTEEHRTLIRVKRQERGWSLVTAASRVGITQSYLFSIERGTAHPYRDVTEKLLAVFADGYKDWEREAIWYEPELEDSGIIIEIELEKNLREEDLRRDAA